MLTIEHTSVLLMLLSTTLAIAISPGPALFFVMAHSIMGGHRSGLASAAGLSLGTILLCIVSAYVALTIGHLTPLSRDILRYVACAYLIYLSLRLIARSGPVPPQSTMIIQSYLKIMLGGFILNITNPYLLFIYIGVIPQFSYRYGYFDISNIIRFGLVYSFSAILVYLAIVALFGFLHAYSLNCRFRSITQRWIPAVMLAAAALYLSG